MIELLWLSLGIYLIVGFIVFLMSLQDRAGFLNSLFAGVAWPFILLFIIGISLS